MRVIRSGTSTRFGNYVIPLDEVWLYIREYENGRIKYSFGNAPADIARSELDRAATMRWPIEQCFGECKGNLGMDQYETRSWQAWHLHMLLVMIAHLFTISLRQLFKKTPILSMPMAKALIWASLLADKKIISNTLRLIDYHLKRNMKAFQSHRKKKMPECYLLSL